VLEAGGTVSYYSGLTRGRLTPNDLATITSYVRGTSNGPVYLALSTLHRSAYHPTVASLLDASNGFSPVFSIADARGRVVVFRLQ
jgi:hypothetical protein